MAFVCHKPILSYIRPFGCHVTILNTLSLLGKFDEKSDEGFLLGIGHRWMFDLDYLTDSMNYIPVSLQNQANPAGSKEVIDIDVQTEEAADSDGGWNVPVTAPTSTNPVNTGSDNLNTGFEEVNSGNIEAISPSADHEEEVFSDADDDEMPEIRIYDKSSEVKSLELPYTVQTRSSLMGRSLHDHAYESWWKAMQRENCFANQFKLQQGMGLGGSYTIGAKVDRNTNGYTGTRRMMSRCLLSETKQGLVVKISNEVTWLAYLVNLTFWLVKAAITTMETMLPLTMVWFVHVFQGNSKDFSSQCSMSNEVLQVSQEQTNLGLCYLRIQLDLNPVYHSKTKHIKIRHHFIRDCYEKKLISVEKIHTDLNVADLLTKPFDGPRFNYLVVSIGFAEIVDFLRGSNLRYALTANPTIYDSLVKQFWQSAVASTREDGSLEISATVDTKRYIISEASIRDSLQLDDATGITMLPNDDLFQGMGQIGYPTDGTFTFWKSFFTPQWRYLVHHLLHCISSKSGGWDQFGSNIATALICLSTGRVYNFSKLIFDGMMANLKNKKKFLMYPRFLQIILNIQTENKHPYLAVSLTKKIFGNMKRGFQGAPRPLLPSMLLVATNPIAGQEHAAQAQSQPSPTPPPIPTSTSPPPPIPSPTPPPIPTSTSPPPPIPSPTPPPIPTPTSPPPPPETEPTTDEYLYEKHSPVHHHFSPSQEQAPSRMPMDDLLHTVPKLISRIDSLELDLKQTKLTMGNAIVKLVKKVKKLEGFLKRRNLVLTDSEDEEPEAQGRKSQADPQDSSIQGLVTPPTTKAHASAGGTIGSYKPNTLLKQPNLSTSKKRETPKKQRKQILQEEVALQSNKLDSLQKEEEVSKIHLDALLALRIAEMKSWTEQQKKGKAQMYFKEKDFAKKMVDLCDSKERSCLLDKKEPKLKGTGHDPITAEKLT
ncbi:hypothetical protein Tco_0702069 [Tanacetum coccineum]|uniref:Uncharacterized protein n=1 Tax=Tanacetum coccineum TaxID=301880 RepID=A0ABQ4XWX0_9ASTR